MYIYVCPYVSTCRYRDPGWLFNSSFFFCILTRKIENREANLGHGRFSLYLKGERIGIESGNYRGTRVYRSLESENRGMVS